MSTFSRMDNVMEDYTRHFVSQHLGKAMATVQFLDEGAGHVRIAAPQLSAQRVEYAFALDQVAQLVPERSKWAETVVRIAINQAHKQYLLRGQQGLFEPGRELAIDILPWVGDLDAAPYGGATAGFTQRER